MTNEEGIRKRIAEMTTEELARLIDGTEMLSEEEYCAVVEKLFTELEAEIYREAKS